MRRIYWLFLALTIGTVAWVLATSPLVNNPTAGINTFFRVQAEKGFYTTALATPLEPFHIDLEASEESCPNLTRNSIERWRSAIEQMMPHEAGSEYFYSEVVRIHLLESGYTLFVIDRETKACVQEVPLHTFDKREAQRLAERRRIVTGANIWQRIDPTDDWTYVYSGEDDS